MRFRLFFYLGFGEVPFSLLRTAMSLSGHSGVSVGLFSEKALQLFLQNARPPGSLRSPSVAAPQCPFRTFQCFGRLISRFRTDPPSVRRCSAGLIGSAKRSGSSRFAAFGGRGKLRSPLHPSLLPPRREADRRAGGKRTRPDRRRNRARRRRRRYAAAQRTPARRSRARGFPVRGRQRQDRMPRGGPGEPQRPRPAKSEYTKTHTEKLCSRCGF